MADQTLACPNCGQETIFADVDEAPKGVICGDCGPGNVLGAPTADATADAARPTSSSRVRSSARPATSSSPLAGETAAADDVSARDAALGEFTEA